MIKIATKDQIISLIKKDNPINCFGYVKNIVKPLALEQLNNYILQCKECDLKCRKKSITFGNPYAKIMIISDYIIDIDKDLSKPFIGTEYEIMLSKTLEMCNLTLDDVFIINSVNCYPCEIDSNKKLNKVIPHTDMVNRCKPFILQALDIIEPELVLLLGPLSLNLFKEASLNKEKGKLFTYGKINMVATYSPSYFKEYENVKDEDTLNEEKWEFVEHITNAINTIFKEE